MRIHLAGCEDFKFVNAVAFTGHPFALSSHYYLSNHRTEKQQQVVETFNRAKVEVIIDSGIFTMMFGAGKGKKYELSWMIDYAHKYIEMARGYGFERFVLVECDVHKILGMDAVFQLREIFEKSGLEAVYVWHREEGMEGLKRLANRYRYIALGCPELRFLFKGRDQNYKQAVWDLLARINDATQGTALPKVHLLGNTVMETMETHLAYSCDSTSWIAGVKFGRCPVFSNGRLSGAHIRSPVFQAIRKRYAEANMPYFEWVMRNIEKPSSREYYLSIYASAMAFKEYQEWLDRKYTWKGDESKLKGRF